MEKFIKLEVIALVLFFLVMGENMRAEQYTIVFLNTPNIKIGEKFVKQGDIFDSKETICWSNNDKQLLKVKDEMGKMYKITRRAFLSYEKEGVKIKSLSDYSYFTRYISYEQI